MTHIVEITARYLDNRQETQDLLELRCKVDGEGIILPTPSSGVSFEDGARYRFRVDQDGQVDWGDADDGTESRLIIDGRRAEVGEYLSRWDRYGPGETTESVYRIERVVRVILEG